MVRLRVAVSNKFWRDSLRVKITQKNMQLPSNVTSIGDEALFKDSPAKEDCPICFLPMPIKVLCCVSLSPATITSVPIYNFADANEEVAKIRQEEYYPCCGKSGCGGCIHSIC